MSPSKKKRQKDQERPWIFKGHNEAIPGVPARDLTEDEHAEAVEAGRIVDGDPTGRLYVYAAANETSAEKGAK